MSDQKIPRGLDYVPPLHQVIRLESRCIDCALCVKECANGVHTRDAKTGKLFAQDELCVNCQRCVSFCPTHALQIAENPNVFRRNANWTPDTLRNLYNQANSGAALLSSMGNPKELPVYWDRLLINASQVTNPSIDPLREPMETHVSLGKKP